MKARCCRSLPRCADCPVVVAAAARRFARTPAADVFATVRAAPPRELPVCVVDALQALDQGRLTGGVLDPGALGGSRFARDGGD